MSSFSNRIREWPYHPSGRPSDALPTGDLVGDLPEGLREDAAVVSTGDVSFST
jgi:hypothetical protein